MGTGQGAYLELVASAEPEATTLGMLLIVVLLQVAVDDVELTEDEDEAVDMGAMPFDAEERTVNPCDPEAIPPYPAALP